MAVDQVGPGVSLYLRFYVRYVRANTDAILRLAHRYERNYNKFLDIFRLDRRIPSYFVPGNNDVGYASCLISIEGFHSLVFHQPEHRCYIRPPSAPQIHISLRAAEPAHHCP